MFKFKNPATKALSTLLVFLIVIGLISTKAPAATKTIKIMPVGDSCTEGMGGGEMGSYRTDLYKLLTDAGLSIDFVGSQRSGPNSLPDKDHEGHSGWTIPQVASNINNWLNTHNPDVVFLWIGGNDLLLNNNLNATGLSNLIDQIFTVKPNVTLFVADYYPWPDAIKQYNAVIPGIVQQKANAGKKVYFVKLSDIQFDRNTDISWDGLHLSTTGYTKVAQLWYKYTIDILRALANGTQPTPSTAPTSTPGTTPSTTPGTTPGKTKTIKIMPVGDSCTEGMGEGEMGAYRTDLYKLLTDAGLSIDFVGSQRSGPNSLPDKDHEGHSGWTIPQVASNINNWLNTYNPDVVFLWIGGNDMFVSGGSPNPTGLSNLIDQIFTVKPNITLFVADYYPWPEMVKQYNALIPGIVQQKASEGKKVYFVKLSDIQFDRYTDISADNLHLTVTGYSKIAQLWYKYTVGILKSMVDETQPSPTPSNPPQGKKGDVNSDGQVNSTDYSLLKRYILKFVGEDAINASNADINNDGRVNSSDATALKRMLLRN
ncbi:MAG TPA: GDSL-type esterase/lipase family protein [Acetivibrio sp.]|uniref:GDSL-type esterase/lipase family protein n=1 Tax=Acetivibrio sp. TaxID=1872092 RepID=UPI002CA3A35A|nr:GDSL-type esterase/lipase family protein [Acetivibrio sp.]HOM01384.1 GDSL-type esterase/lipase family protein [Acetivibrio sp.]